MMSLIFKSLRYLQRLYTYIGQSYYRRTIKSGGSTLKFYGMSLPIMKGEDCIALGEGVKLNEFCYLYARSGAQIYIGSYSTVSSFARLITAGYDLDKWLLESSQDTVDIHINKDIVIGEHCWIGNGATILPGVQLTGSNVVVAAGAVVSKSFSESNIILGGVPAKIIKEL